MKIDRLLLEGLEYLGWRTGIRRQVRLGGSKTQKLFYPPYRKAVSGAVSVLHKAVPDRYTDANSFKILNVDPSNIVFKTQSNFRHRGWVVSGDWDRHRCRIDESEAYRCLKRRFIDGKSWEKCGYVDYAREEIKSDAIAWGLSSEAQIEDRCTHLDNLYESIRDEGYKSQKELIDTDPDNTFAKNVDTIHPELNEVGVDIGRNGELLWNRVGYHRLILAKLLNINTIPVLVYRRHKKWQDVRETISKGKIPEEVDLGHPDLINIIKN